MSDLARAEAARIQKPPPPGAANSIALPGSDQPGRSKIYRHWRFPDSLLQTIDPEVRTTHDFFEQAGQ